MVNDNTHTLISNINALKEEFDLKAKPLRIDLDILVKLFVEVDESSSKSWLGYHASLYFHNFEKPGISNMFSPEWGLMISPDRLWEEKSYQEVEYYILTNFSGKNLDEVTAILEPLLHTSKELKEEIIIQTSFISGDVSLQSELQLYNELEKLEWQISPQSYINLSRPKNVASRDSTALLQGIRTPPHYFFVSKVYSLLSKIQAIEDFTKLSLRLLRQIQIKTAELPATAENLGHYIAVISNLCDKFHTVSRQIRARHDSRPTIEISDEYDVQDLIHALLKLNFNDVRPEDYVPSYAGGASRIDFSLREAGIVLEIKKTRRTLKEKEVGEQLLIDIGRYRIFPGVKTLICFVYDPDGFIANPRGLETDIAKLSSEEFTVIVFIRP